MSKKGIWRVVAVLCLAVVMTVASGCASSKKPKPANPYKGVMSDRGNVPPAYAEPSGPQSLKAGPGPAAVQASVPAPTDDLDGDSAYLAKPLEEAEVAAEEEGPAEIQEVAIAPADGGAADAPAAHKQSFPVVANGKVPSADLTGKGAAKKGGASSSGKAASAANVAAGGTYVVKSGDILGRIANAHNVKVSDIKALNPDINPDKLIVGQKLVMPAGATNLDAKGDASKGDATTAKASGSGTAKKGREPIPADGLYTVAANDSLWKIGDRFGVSVSDIRTWNGLTSDRLKIGQQLKLRGEGGEAPKADNAPKTDGPVETVPEGSAGGTATATEAPAAEANVRVIEYFVCEGDTIDSICNATEILREDFLQANPAVRSDADLKVGMPVRLIMR